MIGRYERLKKNIKESVEFDIDFSELEVDGYVYHKSTYIQGGITAFSNRILRKKGRISGLITQENMQLISKLIPVYNNNEKIVRILKWIIDGNWSAQNITDSILYQTYCNGFTTGYKEIDKRITELSDRMISVSSGECNNYIDRYVKKLHDHSIIPTQDKNLLYFWEYFIELGKREGATVRGLLYARELDSDSNMKLSGRSKSEEKRVFSDIIINLDKNQKEDLLERIHEYVSNGKEAKGKALGLMFVCLQNLQFINTKVKEQIIVSDFCRILRNTFPELDFNDKGIYKYSEMRKLDAPSKVELKDLEDKLNVLE